MRPVVTIVVVAALVIGCGSGSSTPEPSVDGQASQAPLPTAPPSPSPAANPSAVVTLPPATPTQQSAPSGDPIPAELPGQWRAELPADTPRYASFGTVVDLTVAPETYRIKLQYGQITGKVAASGDELIFTNSTEDNCSGSGTGRYAWEMAGDQLTFIPLVPDECPARATFFELPYTRQP